MRAGLLPQRQPIFDNARIKSYGVNDENFIQPTDRGIDACGLYQQQQPRAAAEDHRGGASGVDDHRRLPGRVKSALPVALQSSRAPPQLPGEDYA